MHGQTLYWVGLGLPWVGAILLLPMFHLWFSAKRQVLAFYDVLPIFLILSIQLMTVGGLGQSILPICAIAFSIFAIVLAIQRYVTYPDFVLSKYFHMLWRCLLLSAIPWYLGSAIIVPILK